MTDEELMAAVAQRDETALAWLMSRYQTLLMSIAGRRCHANEAMDIVNKVWHEVWERGGYNPEHGPFKSWITTITVRQAADHDDKILRRRKYEYNVPGVIQGLYPQQHELNPLTGEQPLPIDEQLNELRRKVIPLLEPLPFDQRVAVELNLMGHSSTDIAEIVGVPRSTVKTRLDLAYKKLETLIPGFKKPFLRPGPWGAHRQRTKKGQSK